MARELYIYWRVRAGRSGAAQEAAARMQVDLQRAHAGLSGRLLVRAPQGDEATLMEVYTRAPNGIDAVLQSAIEDAAVVLQPFGAGPRHIEVFEAVVP